MLWKPCLIVFALHQMVEWMHTSRQKICWLVVKVAAWGKGKIIALKIRPEFWLFLNSVTSVKVFTRMVSDNPWCSLLTICSLRWKYNVTFTHCIPNHSQPEWMTINRFFFKWIWNLINFKKTFQTDQSATYLLGICSHFAQFTRCECEGHKCSQADARKYKLFFVFQDSSIPKI